MMFICYWNDPLLHINFFSLFLLVKNSCQNIPSLSRQAGDSVPSLSPLLCHNWKKLSPQGTVSQDWDGLLVVWMDKALFGDEPLYLFVTIYCFFVFNFEFYFLQRYCTKIAFLYVAEATLLQMCYGNSMARGYWQLSDKFCIGCQRLLVTHWQISQRVWQLLQISHICQRVTNTL